MLPRSKHNQTTKFGQLIQYNGRNIYLQKSCRKWDKATSPDIFLFYKKALCKIQLSGQHLSFNVFW